MDLTVKSLPIRNTHANHILSAYYAIFRYDLMKKCWSHEARDRPNFNVVHETGEKILLSIDSSDN